MDLSATERKLVPENIKKETREYYNYEIKGHLVRNYRKPKTESGL